ncbi:MAG: toast rack family protein [Candidatus Acidiferrales bacterium]
MGAPGSSRRGSMVGAIILIAIGVIFLMANIWPDFDPWPVLARYWPLILIFIGAGMLWDHYRRGQLQPGETRKFISGTLIALLALLVFFSIAFWRVRKVSASVHMSQSVDRQGAQSVSANIEIPAGSLEVSGGSHALLDADFDYRESQGKPRVEYSVSGTQGHLEVTQGHEEDHDNTYFGTSHNDWKLHFTEDVPLAMSINQGAGDSELRLRGLQLTHLEVNIGAGQMNLDLTGDRKADLSAEIQGGVGSATIHLPRNICVRAQASGGIGSVSAGDMDRDGDEYVNHACGKSGPTITLEITGGVGSISLVQEP